MTVFAAKDCKHVQSLMDDFLSGELIVETNQEILTHLGLCAGCSEEKSFREQIREDLIDSWRSQPVPDGLENKLSDVVVARQPIHLASMRWAASLLIFAAVSLASLLLLPLKDSALQAFQLVNHYSEVLEDHFGCSGELPTDGESVPLDLHRASLERVLGESSGAYRLVDVRICSFKEVHFTHYAFEGRERRLSLIFEARKSSEQLPELRGQLEKRLKGVDIHLVSRASASIVSMESPGYFVYLVTEETTPDDVLLLAEEVVPLLKQSLSDRG